jgi:hypothetical protein
VGEYSFWVDVPSGSNDEWRLEVGAGENPACLIMWQFDPNPKPIGPEWFSCADDWGVFAGTDWLRMSWVVEGGVPEPGEEHMGGLFLDRVRVGIPLSTGVAPDVVPADGLSRIYPNPFNPSTTIEYSLARRAHTTIRVVDLAGRVVATLLDGPAGPGAARVTWDGTTDGGHHVASGVYFVELETGGFRDSRKTVLLR